MPTASHNRRRLAAAGLVAAILAVAIPTRLTSSLGRLLGTDEADYARALSLGLPANYLGTAERSGFAFIRDVVTEYRTTGWARPFQRDWTEGDAAGLRHYHPPPGLYPVALIARGAEGQESQLRAVPVAIGVIACLATAWLGWTISAGRGSMALLAGILAATSPYHVAASTELSFHAAFSLFSTATLAALASATRDSGMRWWIVASIALGLSILTVPYWALLVPGYVWVGAGLVRRDGWRPVTTAIATIMLTVLVAWPPFLLNGGALKPLLMYGGLLVRPLAVVEQGAGTTWLRDLATTHWPSVALLVVGAVTGLVNRRRPSPATVPVLIYCLLFIGLNLRVAHMKPLYAADVVGPMSALAAVALLGFSPAVRGVLVGLTAATAVSVHLISHAPEQAWPQWRSAMAALAKDVAGHRVLVTPRPAGAILAYYAPGTSWVLDSSHPEDRRQIQQELAAGRIDAVVRWGRTFEPQGVARAATARQPETLHVVERTEVRVYRLRHRSDEPGAHRPEP